MAKSTVILWALIILFATPMKAYAKIQSATHMMSLTQIEIEKIENDRWRNHAYRDLAVSLAFIDDLDAAMALIPLINNTDTQAMTIRAIGMSKAIHQDLPPSDYKALFTQLDKAAQQIDDEGARDIAYTYIAMAQAFAGLDADATATTAQMKNPALKHKAYGETAEIQAERGDFNAAMRSIQAIESTAFKNKALGIVSGIFLKKGEINHALTTAQMITNPTKKAESFQKIINHQIGLDRADD